jgi:hypothetical protein
VPTRSSIVAAVLVTAALVLAPAAHARPVVSLSPTVGDFETAFTLTGTGWQPSRAIRVEYFNVDLNRSPFKTFSRRTNNRGQVFFRLVQPQVFAEQSSTQRLCFVQSGRRRCGRFYVAAPAANVEPSDVKRGANLLLRLTGWPAGFNLDVDLFRPDGTRLTPAAKLTTRSLEPGFAFAGAPFNNVFLPRGGAFLNFLADASSPVGLYTFYVHPPNQTVGSRTAFVVFP